MGISRAVVAGKPLLPAVGVVFDRHIVEMMRKTPPSDVNTAKRIDGESGRKIISRPSVISDPLLHSLMVVFNCCIVLRFIGGVAPPGHVDIAIMINSERNSVV